MEDITTSSTRAAQRANGALPSVISVTQAVHDLVHTRFIYAFYKKPILLIIPLIALGGAFFVQPYWAIMTVLGSFLGFCLLTGLYILWHARFIHNIRKRKPLCTCSSRMWQFSCARCKESVPPLAFWGDGSFLRLCPHCDLPLSASKGTLLAWCSTCHAEKKRPDLFYGKPAHVIVWLSRNKPKTQPDDAWQVIFRDEKERYIQYYYSQPKDRHSSSILYACADEPSEGEPLERLDDFLREQTRLLVLYPGIPQERKDGILGLFNEKYTRIVEAGEFDD